METSDLPSDADNTNATIPINVPTESKSVKRRSRERSQSARMRHRIGIDTCMSHPGIRDAVEDGGSNTMSRSRNYSYSMTLRLTTPMQCEVENLAYDSRLSKAQFIRIALRRAIADAHEHATQNTYLQSQGGAL